MLNSLSSFLFSTVPSQEALTTSTNSNYDMQELEGDWLLVDRIDTNSDLDRSMSDHCGLQSSTESLSADDTDGTKKLSLYVPLGPLENQMTPPSSPSSQQMMDGSWYVTPPPCFTAGSPGYLETSPLENLLIEHPSMSVYGPVSNFSFLNLRRSESPCSECSRHTSVEKSCGDLDVSSAEEVENTDPIIRRGSNQRARRHQQYARSLSATLDAAAVEERLLSIQAHKVQYRHEQRKLKSSAMERQNRTHLKFGKGNSQRKTVYLMQPNKNRRC